MQAAHVAFEVRLHGATRKVPSGQSHRRQSVSAVALQASTCVRLDGQALQLTQRVSNTPVHAAARHCPAPHTEQFLQTVSFVPVQACPMVCPTEHWEQFLQVVSCVAVHVAFLVLPAAQVLQFAHTVFWLLLQGSITY